MDTFLKKTKLPFLHSLRFKLAARFVLVFSVILFLLSFLAYYEFNSYQTQEFDRSLYNYSVDVAHAINVDSFGGVSFDVDSLIGNGKSFPFAIGHSFVQLIHLDGTIIGKSRDLGADALPVSLSALKSVAQEHFYFQTVRADGLPHVKNVARSGYRQVSLLLGSNQLPNFILQIAVPLTYVIQERERFSKIYLVVIPVALLISLLGGIYLSRRAFVPIQLIIEKTKLFDPTNLEERLPIPPTSDELFTLSTVLNNLLDRIQKMFISQERFIADASHELKTPLTILRGELELASKKVQTPEEIQDLMKSMGQELDYLSRVVNNLLLLARVEGGSAFLTRSSVRFDEVVMDAVSRVQKLAREKDVSINLDLKDEESSLQNSQRQPFVVHGDEDLLRSMTTELISNAFKYSPPNKTVKVKLTSLPETVLLEIADEGPGVPKGDENKIFQRFYRAPGLDAPGSGLGLSIAQKIIEAHGGLITYSKLSEGVGSLFTIQIKKL